MSLGGPLVLPFLKPKRLASTIIASRKANGTAGESKSEDSEHPLTGKAESLIQAIHAKDASAVAELLGSLNEKAEPKKEE